MSIYTKLFEIQKQNLLLTADADNPFFKSKYISIENIMSTLKPLLEQQKLLLFHNVTDNSVVTNIRDIEDENTDNMIMSFFPLNPSLDAQKKGAEITYGKRYNLVALFCIVEDDDDGNFASGKTIPQSYETTTPTTYQAKSPFKSSYAQKTANSDTSKEPDKWLNEKDIDKMLTDMIDGKIPLANGATEIIKKQRANGVGISKKVAGYIEEQYIKRIADIAFPGPSTPLVTKNGVEDQF